MTGVSESTSVVGLDPVPGSPAVNGASPPPLPVTTDRRPAGRPVRRGFLALPAGPLVVWCLATALLGLLVELGLTRWHEQAMADGWRRLTTRLHEVRAGAMVALADEVGRVAFAGKLCGRPANAAEVAPAVSGLRTDLNETPLRVAVFDGAGRPVPGGDFPAAVGEFFAALRAKVPGTPPLRRSVARRLARDFPGVEHLLRMMRPMQGNLTRVLQWPGFDHMLWIWRPGMPSDRVAGILVAFDLRRFPGPIPAGARLAARRASTPEAPVILWRVVEPLPDLPPALTRSRMRRVRRDYLAGREGAWTDGGWLLQTVRAGADAVLVAAAPAPVIPWGWGAVLVALYLAGSVHWMRRRPTELSPGVAGCGTTGAPESPGHPGSQAEVGARFPDQSGWLDPAVAGGAAVAIIPQRPPGWSLGTRLFWYLSLALGLPVLASVVVGSWWAEERWAGIQQAHQREVIGQAMAIEQGYRASERRRERAYQQLTDGWRRTGLDPDRIEQDLARLVIGMGVEWPVLIASTGRMVPEWHPQLQLVRRGLLLDRPQRVALLGQITGRATDIGPAAARLMGSTTFRLASTPADLLRPLRTLPIQPQTRSFMGTVAQLLLGLHDRSRGFEDANRQDLLRTGVLSTGVDEMRRRLSMHRGRYQQYTSIMMWHDILTGPDGRGWYLVSCEDRLGEMERQHLRRVLARNGGFRPGIAVRALGRSIYRLPLAAASEVALLDPFVEPEAGTENERHGELVIASEAVRVSAFLGRELGYTVIVMTPWRMLRERWFGELALALAALGVLLLVGVGFWFRLRSAFLGPVAELARGLAAMRERRYDVHLVPLADDELGQVCRAFAAALRRLPDMDIAASLQTALLPARRCVLGPFELVGRSVMMQAVGGDYFDFMPLGSSTMAVALGDVSGHGVGAALVTTMAWAAMPELIGRHPASPGAALGALNRALHAQLRKAKMMTCHLSYLEAATGRVTMASAGQTYPLLVAPDGSTRYEKVAGMPLGIREKLTFKDATLSLADDAMILYSDGLPEALDGADRALGYEGFARLAATAVSSPGEAALDALLAAVARFSGGRPAVDDASLVIIRRVGG